MQRSDAGIGHAAIVGAVVGYFVALAIVAVICSLPAPGPAPRWAWGRSRTRRSGADRDSVGWSTPSATPTASPPMNGLPFTGNELTARAGSDQPDPTKVLRASR